MLLHPQSHTSLQTTVSCCEIGAQLWCDCILLPVNYPTAIGNYRLSWQTIACLQIVYLYLLLHILTFCFYKRFWTIRFRLGQFQDGTFPVAEEMNFDEILNDIGGFGKFQKILYVWICAPQIFLAFHMLVSVFTGAVPPHLCRSMAPLKGLPDFKNFSHLTGLDGHPELSCNASLNHSSAAAPEHAVSCQEGWEYSKDTFQSTTVSEVSGKAEALSTHVWFLWIWFPLQACTSLWAGSFFLQRETEPESFENYPKCYKSYAT